VRVVLTPSFRRAAKRLHANQKRDLDDAVKALMADPGLGEQKLGDLSWLRVHKFRMVNQLTLLGYEWLQDTVILHCVGSHENFYRDLKSR
jgi:mRNA interferase YafQ